VPCSHLNLVLVFFTQNTAALPNFHLEGDMKASESIYDRLQASLTKPDMHHLRLNSISTKVLTTHTTHHWNSGHKVDSTKWAAYERVGTNGTAKKSAFQVPRLVAFHAARHPRSGNETFGE